MEFVRAAEFFHGVATEERLVIQLISEGLHFIESKKWEDAISLLNEAESLDRWTDLYGGKIYSSLAFANAQIGNYTKAKDYLALHKKVLGQYYSQLAGDELLRIQTASQLCRSLES